MSYLVIAIHVASICSGTSYFLIDKIWSLAVPFFFLASGFFLFKSYNKGGIKKIDSYLHKSVKLYILYTLIYLPITLIGIYLDDIPIWKGVLVFMRNILFVGENYFSWHLWFLLALIVSTVILRCMLYFKVKICNIFWIGLILTFIGLGLNYFMNNRTNTFVDSIIDIYRLVFQTTRNGFFIGFWYVSAGFLIACYEEKLYKYLKWQYLVLILSYILYLYQVPFSLNIVSSMLFIILVQKNIYNGDNNIWFRKMSTIIYFFHMYFVFALNMIIESTDIKLSFIGAFVIILIVSTIFSAFILRLSETKYFSFLKSLLG